MTLIEDEADLAEQLQRAAVGFQPGGSGPSLAAIRRGGLRRRHQRRAALVGGAAAVVAVAGAGGLALHGTQPDRLTTSFATDGVPVASAQAKVTRAMHSALTQAGIAHPSAPAGLVVREDAGSTTELGWLQQWNVTAGYPQVHVEFAVFPRGDILPSAYPCAEAPELSRACSDVTLSDGTRIVAGESRGHTITAEDPSGAQRAAMWTPSAVAIYPDGRQASLTVGLSAAQPNPTGAPSATYDYTAGVTLAQLQDAVSNPVLVDITTQQQ